MFLERIRNSVSFPNVYVNKKEKKEKEEIE
jgi:hypothetical protein